MPLCVLFIKGAVELQLELSLTVLKICKIKKKKIPSLQSKQQLQRKGTGVFCLGLNPGCYVCLGSRH